MAKVLRSFPFFTIFGLMTIVLFFRVESMSPEFRETALGQNLTAVAWIVIIPLWIMRILVVMLGGVLFGFGDGSFPIWYNVITSPVHIMPHLLVDVALHNWWRHIHPWQWVRVRS